MSMHAKGQLVSAPRPPRARRGGGGGGGGVGVVYGTVQILLAEGMPALPHAQEPESKHELSPPPHAARELSTNPRYPRRPWHDDCPVGARSARGEGNALY